MRQGNSLVLRRLYGCACALLTGLLLVLMPLSGYFGFNPLMVLPALWALYEYLLLTGRLADVPTAKGRHLLGLAIALFVIVQVNWAGVFYAFVIGAHYVVRCLMRRLVRWKVMTALALPSLLSLGVSFSMMAWGFRNNIAVAAAARAPAEVKIDRGKLMPPLVYKVGPQEKDTAWSLMKTLYQWRAREGELASFSWRAWVGQNLVFAHTNFTAPILLCLAGYLLYLLIAHLHIVDRKVLSPRSADSAKKPIKIPYNFTHMWFFLLPALLFLFTFKGLFWKHQYWQAPFALFVALGAAWGLLLLCEAFEGAHRWFGKSIVASLIVVIAVFGNQGLASYRGVRWHSPRTIELFKQLNVQIPPDKGLLTFKDFVIQQNRAKVASYREEYAWYLDREMAVANAWQYEMYWAASAKIEDVVEATVKEVWRQTQTGCFACYFVPAREELRFDPLYREEQEVGGLLLEANSIPSLAGIQRGALGDAPTGKRTGVTSLKPGELDARLNDGEWDDDQMLFWEKHRRYREALIARLRELYPCLISDNHSYRSATIRITGCG